MATTAPGAGLGVGDSGAVAEIRCPLCDQVLPHERLDEILARIRRNEQAREDAEAQRLEQEVERVRLAAAASAETQITQARAEAAATLETAQEQFAAREAAARAEGESLGEAAAAEAIAAADQAKAAADLELGVLKEAQAAELARVLQEQREALEIASQKAINAEKAKAFEEKQKIEEKLEQVQRQLQKKTADELGEGAEVDLYEALRAEFPADKITRVKKGEAGADIVHRVMENARESGVILYDSKNRGVWRNDYVSKLRDDQIAEKADIAILATRVFPAGVRQLHIQDGVIITNPARALALVSIIRRHIVQIHALRLSNEARDEKMVRLYDFISSERCSVLFEQMETLADDLLDLDVKEQKAHSSVWNRRGMLIKSLQRAESQLSLELDQILGHQSHDTVAAV